METLKQVLMRRDGLTETEAETQIKEASQELTARIDAEELLDDFCEEYFGLEPDYLPDLLGGLL